MWHATRNAIKHEDWDNALSFPILAPDWSKFPGECLSLERDYHDFRGYDDWVQSYPRAEEIDLITDTIASLRIHPRRVHIAWISARESVEALREYYRELWYEDELAKNYTLPSGVLLTASTTLRHILWCEKDKEFLKSSWSLSPCPSPKERGIRKKKQTPSPLGRVGEGLPLYALTPPLRTPADLRSLQQGSRMGIIIGIEVFPGDESCIADIFSRQILTPFQMVQLLSYQWEQYGFSGTEKICTLEFPDFPWEIEDSSF